MNGDDAPYLCHWMPQSGLTDLLPSLHDTVWVGFSADSMVMTPVVAQPVGVVRWQAHRTPLVGRPAWANLAPVRCCLGAPDRRRRGVGLRSPIDGVIGSTPP